MSDNNDIGTVVFRDVLDQYTAEQDVLVSYRVRKTYIPSREDWVGIFPENWIVLDDAISVRKVQKPSKRNKRMKNKAVVFDASSFKVVPDLSELYQFVYVTSDRQVFGLSNLFSFCEDKSDIDTDPHILEAPTTTEQTPVTEQQAMITPLPELPSETPEAISKPDFTVTPSGTAMLNQFDLLMDQELRGYLENPERALVPFCPVFGPPLPECEILYEPEIRFDLQCLLDPTKDMPWLEDLAELLCSPSPQQPTQTTPALIPPSNPPTSPTTVKCANCHNCQVKQRQLRAMKEKLMKTKRSKRRVMAELHKTRESYLEKDFELEGKNNQLDQLKKENVDLAERNDLQTNQMQWLTTGHDQMMEELNEAIRLYRKEKARAQDLTEQVTVLTGEKENLETKYLMADTDREFNEGENFFLKEEVSHLNKQKKSLESTIDDIMFTLSILGYTRIIYPDGRVKDLTNSSTGSCMELLGVTASEGDTPASLAVKEDEIVKLKNEVNEMRNELVQQENHINSLVLDMEELTDLNDFLMEKSNEMAEDLLEAAEKEAALYNQLVDERRLNWLNRMNFQPVTNLDEPVFETEESLQTKNVGTNTQKVTHVTNMTSALPKHKSEQIISTTRNQPAEEPKKGHIQGISSSVLQLGNLFQESETSVDAPKPVHGIDSSLLQHGVLQKLFKESETNTLRPQLSAILQGRVLSKLFREPKEQQPTPKGSSVFKDNVLKNLFRKSSSNISVANLLRENSFASMPDPQGSQCLLECNTTNEDSSVTQPEVFQPFSLKTLAQLKIEGVWFEDFEGESLQRLFHEDEVEEGIVASCSSATPRKTKKRSRGKKSRKCNKENAY